MKSYPAMQRNVQLTPVLSSVHIKSPFTGVKGISQGEPGEGKKREKTIEEGSCASSWH